MGESKMPARIWISNDPTDHNAGIVLRTSPAAKSVGYIHRDAAHALKSALEFYAVYFEGDALGERARAALQAYEAAQ